MLRFAELEAAGAAVAAISDCSDGDCALRTDTPEARRRFLERCGLSFDSLTCPRQIHGKMVAVAHAADRGKGNDGPVNALPGADAVISDVPGIVLGVTVADCVPVYLVKHGGGVGGMVHAGREGTFQNIAAAAVHALKRQYAVEPMELHALIGPSAGPCCYEVSEPMAVQFEAAGGVRRGRLLDLWETNRRQLMEAGIPEAQIIVSGRCTLCDGAFHSYRASGGPARNLAILALPE